MKSESLVHVHYCYDNGKVGQEGMPYICIFRNRVDGSFYLGLASASYNASAARYQWYSFDDVPSYPYAYFEFAIAKVLTPEFLQKLKKDLTISFETLFPESSGPQQLDLFK